MASNFDMNKVQQKLTELIECGICDNTKDLVVFRCQHRVCKDCFTKLKKEPVRIPGHGFQQGIVQERKQVHCPFCRQPTWTSAKKEMLPKCRLSAEIKDLQKQLSETAPNYNSCATQTQSINLSEWFSRIPLDIQELKSSTVGYQVPLTLEDKLSGNFNQIAKFEQKKLTNQYSFKNLKNCIDVLAYFSSLNSCKPVGLSFEKGSRSSMRIKRDHDDKDVVDNMVVSSSIKAQLLRSETASCSFETDRWSYLLMQDRNKLDSEIAKIRGYDPKADNLSDRLKWFRKPGFVYSDDSTQKTAIQSLRAKRIRRIIPEELYNSRHVWRSYHDKSLDTIWDLPLSVVGVIPRVPISSSRFQIIAVLSGRGS